MSSALSHPERRTRRAELAADVKEGMELGSAASKYGVSLHWAKSACHEFGVTLPHYHKTAVVEVVAALMRDWPFPNMSGIGRECCITRQRVFQIQQQCLRYGVLKEPHDEHPARDQEVGGSGG